MTSEQNNPEWLHVAVVLLLFIMLNMGKEMGLLQENKLNEVNDVVYSILGGQIQTKFLQRKRQAQRSLELMESERVFDTILTTRESVLQKGFPFQWEPCTLPSIFRAKDAADEDKPLQIAFLGGSATATRATNCGSDNDQDASAMESRYTNLLKTSLLVDIFLFVAEEEKKKAALMDFDIINLGQGSSGSVISALTLDTLLDPEKADVLVYEFFLTDNWNLREADVIKLELWLVRVQSLYQRAKRPVPPILLLFLWESQIGQASREEVFGRGVDLPLHAAWQAMEHYQHLGWNIQAVSVGSAFHNKVFLIAKDPQLIVDQVHQPSCYSAHLIANMIKHALYTDIATCKENPESALPPPSADHGSKWRKDLLADNKDPETRKLVGYLLRDDVRVSSLSLWQPTAGRSTLHLGLRNRMEIAGYPKELTNKAEPFREDLKYAYKIPPCGDDKKPLRFVLLEPELEWLGVGAGSHCVDHDLQSSSIAWKINGMDVEDPDNRKLGQSKGVNWVHIPARMEQRANQYEVSFCNMDKSLQVHLCHLVGVMAPAMSEREIALVELFMS